MAAHELCNPESEAELRQIDAFMRQNGYSHLRMFEKRIACVAPFAFTYAIIVMDRKDYEGMYLDRWCYSSLELAKAALRTWNGEGEPTGWHRHPTTGRRRPDGDPEKEYVNR